MSTSHSRALITGITGQDGALLAAHLLEGPAGSNLLGRPLG